jgi:hypothetical protein
MANWDDIAHRAGEMTDEQLKNKISSLSRLNDLEIEALINDTGISKQDLADVLKVVNDATLSNEKKAAAIKNIRNGVDLLVKLAGKLM